jgi:hypothetical protein
LSHETIGSTTVEPESNINETVLRKKKIMKVTLLTFLLVQKRTKRPQEKNKIKTKRTFLSMPQKYHKREGS